MVNGWGGLFHYDNGAILLPQYDLGSVETGVMGKQERNPTPYFGAMLKWNLSNLVFDMEEPSFGRVFNASNRAYQSLRFEVQRLYEERQRLLVSLFVTPPQEFKEKTLKLLRLEELTAHLDALSGGAYKETLTRLADGSFEREVWR